MIKLQDSSKKSISQQILNKFIRKYKDSYKFYLKNEVHNFLNEYIDIINNIETLEKQITKEIRNGQAIKKNLALKKYEEDIKIKNQLLEKQQLQEEIEKLQQEQQQKNQQIQPPLIIDYGPDRDEAINSEINTELPSLQQQPVQKMFQDNYDLLLKADFLTYRQQVEKKAQEKRYQQLSLRESYQKQVNNKREKLLESQKKDNLIMKSLIQKDQQLSIREKNEFNNQVEKVKNYRFQLASDISNKQNMLDNFKNHEWKNDYNMVNQGNKQFKLQQQQQQEKKIKVVEESKQNKIENQEKQDKTNFEKINQQQQDVLQQYDYLDRFEKEQKNKMENLHSINKYYQRKNDLNYNNYIKFMQNENFDSKKNILQNQVFILNQDGYGLFENLGNYHKKQENWTDVTSVLSKQINDKQKKQQIEKNIDSRQAEIFKQQDRNFNDMQSMHSHQIKQAKINHQQDLIFQINQKQIYKQQNQSQDQRSNQNSQHQSIKYNFRSFDQRP